MDNKAKTIEWCDLTDINCFNIFVNIMIAELKVFHFSNTEDDQVVKTVSTILDSLSENTKHHLGKHLRMLVTTYADTSAEHTVPANNETIIPEFLLYTKDNKYVVMSTTEKGYIRHMVHALCNNIVLILMFVSSSMHSIIPNIQPFWCVERLIQIFINMRMHTPEDTLYNCYSKVVDNMIKSRSDTTNDGRRDLDFSILQSLVKEKDILEKIFPEKKINGFSKILDKVRDFYNINKIRNSS